MKAGRVLRAFQRIGWKIKRQPSSHRVLERPNWPDYTFAFHDGEEIGPITRSRSMTGRKLALSCSPKLPRERASVRKIFKSGGRGLNNQFPPSSGAAPP